MVIRYFKCLVCGKTTPLDSVEIPNGVGLPAIGEYDVLDSDEDDDLFPSESCSVLPCAARVVSVE